MRRFGPAAVAAALVFSTVVVSAQTAFSQQQKPTLGLTVKPAAGGVERAEIVSVAPGSAAETAGLKSGDLLLYAAAPDGERISLSTQDALERWASAQQPGSSQALSYLRGEQMLTANLAITSQQVPPATAPAPTEAPSARLLGLAVKPGAGGASVEITEVRPGSAAAVAGLQVGDVLFSGQMGTANADSLVSQEALDAFAAKSAGTTRDVIYARNKQFLTAKVAVPTVAVAGTPAPTAATRALAGQAPSVNPLTQAVVGLAAASAAPVQPLDVGDPFAQTVTTLNGRGTQLAPFKLRPGQILEAQVAANGAPLMPKLCFEEDDMFNVDPERCYENISMSGQSVVRFRHVASEPEIVTLSVGSTDASAGTYTITTRNGNRGGEGAAALAVLENLAGKPYIVDTVDQGLPVKAAVRYLVDEPGRRGRLRYQIENGSVADFTYALDNNGQLTWASSVNKGVVYLGIDGLLYQQAEDSVGVRGRSPNGEFLNVTERRLRRGDNAAQMHVGAFGRSQRLAASPPATEEQVTALMLDGPMHIAQAQQQRAEDWGPFAQMAGNFYVFMVNNNERIVSYQWETPGQSLSIKYWNSDALGTTPDPQQRMVYDPASRSVKNTVTYTNNSTASTTLKRMADGSMREDGYNEGTWFVSAKDGELTYRMEPLAGKPQLPLQTRRALDANMLKVFAERTQARQARLAQERAAAAAQEQADSGIGLFDVLNFANTVQSAMSSPEGYLAAVTQAAPELAPILNGVAAAQSGGNPLAGLGGLGGANALAAIPGGVNPYTGLGGGRGGALGGVGGGPTGVRGSYPTRPNLAEGSQCPGFTIGNYRTHAFNGGRDQQLFALCGQAFEYYKMYLNAIDQGYSEADSNRTYNAHEGAVRNLQSMLR